MSSTRFERQITSYEKWKTRLVHAVGEYQNWLDKFGLDTPESRQQIRFCLDSLTSERLTITFVAEFSRGKTELINAIFFADYGRRILPSSAGRTTMCPTEFFFDESAKQSYVRLLPIETRLQEKGLMELKKDPDQWVNYPLDATSAEQLELTMKEVIQTRRVTLKEAIRLGLYVPELHDTPAGPPTHVEIPRWRHALISFPHPLLKQGLTILDTPGLNALGSEPELTLNMLPSSQAILFVLAADTGVTRSDLEMWRHHIKGFQSNRQRGVVVVLNKIDTLWDELSDHQSYQRSIDKQVRTTAHLLGVDERIIFPISAQKGLLAKVRGNADLLNQSRLKPLEEYLSTDILNARQQIVQDNIVSEVGNMVENSYGLVSARLNRIKSQMDELRQLSGKSQDVIDHMLQETRREQSAYMRNLNSFQASHKVLKEQTEQLLSHLEINRLNALIEERRAQMTGNWTTHGLRTSMQGLFDALRGNMQAIVEKSEQIRKLIRSIYRHFQNEHGFTIAQPKMLSLMRYRVALELLYQEAEDFRNSPTTALMEKHFLVKRFFNAMVIQARQIFEQARHESESWTKIAMEPLIHQLRDHKEHIEQHLADLQNISRSRETLTARIDELQRHYNVIARQLTSLRNIHSIINDSQSFVDEAQPKVRLVK